MRSSIRGLVLCALASSGIAVAGVAIAADQPDPPVATGNSRVTQTAGELKIEWVQIEVQFWQSEASDLENRLKILGKQTAADGRSETEIATTAHLQRRALDELQDARLELKKARWQANREKVLQNQQQ